MEEKNPLDFVVRRARRGAEACARMLLLIKARLPSALSPRGFFATGLFFCAVVFGAYFLLSGRPPQTPPPSASENPAAGPAGPVFGDSSGIEAAHLYVSMEAVLSQVRRKQEVLLVDVRDKESFEKFRIPGAIRIPLFALKTKAFLRQSAFVLVSEGYPDAVLERTCRELRAAGFAQACILEGGLGYWQQKNGPIEGDGFAASEVGRIAPNAYFAAPEPGRWLVVTVSAQPAAPSDLPLPGAQHLAWEGDPAKFASGLKAAVLGRAKSPLISVLVCDEKGTRYAEIERAVQQEEVGKVFYLRGGIEGYRAFLEQQALMRRPGEEEAKKCASCS